MSWQKGIAEGDVEGRKRGILTDEIDTFWMGPCSPHADGIRVGAFELNGDCIIPLYQVEIGPAIGTMGMALVFSKIQHFQEAFKGGFVEITFSMQVVGMVPEGGEQAGDAKSREHGAVSRSQWRFALSILSCGQPTAVALRPVG